jgi:adenylate cyclase
VGLLFRALVELVEMIGRLNGELSLPRPLAFGAGVNSGLAVTGNMGSSGLADHTAMGDAVNKAFRLETASKEIGRELVLGASTLALLPEAARGLFTPHSVLLKGYDAPEDVYALTLGDLPRLLEALGR